MKSRGGFQIATVGCAMVMASMMFVGCESDAHSDPEEAVGASERSEDSSGRESAKVERASDGVEDGVTDREAEPDAEVTSTEGDDGDDIGQSPRDSVKIGRGVDSATDARDALDAYLQGESDEDKSLPVDEVDTVGDWTFYQFTKPTRCGYSLVTIFPVGDGDDIVDGGPEELGRLYESLELFEGGDVPKEQLLTAAQYLVSRSAQEELIRSADDELPVGARRHFADVEMEAPRFERHQDGMTIQYLTIGESSCTGTTHYRLRRYEITVSKDYDVEVDHETVSDTAPSRPDESMMNTSVELSDDDTHDEELIPVLRARERHAEACYEAELVRNREASGTIRVELNVDADERRGGRWRVTDANALTDTVGDDVGACIANALKGALVPSPEGDEPPESVVVIYEFSPKSEE